MSEIEAAIAAHNEVRCSLSAVPSTDLALSIPGTPMSGTGFGVCDPGTDLVCAMSGTVPQRLRCPVLA
eukprot:3301554-Rhodomonas_salina.2